MKKILQTIIVIIFFYFPIATQAEIKPIIEGSNDAKIKIIIFESLTCSHCANFHKKIYPSLKKLLFISKVSSQTLGAAYLLSNFTDNRFKSIIC